MNKEQRYEMIKAMDLIARSFNNEYDIEKWLINGVADGDINSDTSADELEHYMEDENFADLMDTFLWICGKARKDGLYVDGIVSRCNGSEMLLHSDYAVTSPDKLRQLCINNDWFTCGDTDQYEMLFDANRKSASLDEMATIIYICSDATKHSKRDILSKLAKSRKEYILESGGDMLDIVSNPEYKPSPR